MATKNTFDYNSSEYKQFLRTFRDLDENQHMLIVIAGDFTTDRKISIDEMKREVLGDAVEIDLTDIITPDEEESFMHLNEVIQSISVDAPLVIFRNAELLNGEYTGFTSSIVRYATPQEKNFLKQVSTINAPVVLEFKDQDHLDMTVRRVADAVVICKAPNSFIEKIAWKIQNIHVHGSKFLSPRPH